MCFFCVNEAHRKVSERFNGLEKKGHLNYYLIQIILLFLSKLVFGLGSNLENLTLETRIYFCCAEEF